MAVFSDDFEGGDTSSWTSETSDGSNAIAVNGDAALHGSNGADYTFDGANNDNYLRKTFSAQNSIYMRAYFNVAADDTGVSARDVFRFLLQSSGNYRVDLVLYTHSDSEHLGYSLKVNNSHQENKYNQEIFAIGTTYCIEIYYKVDAVAGGGQLWIDGSSDGFYDVGDTSGNTTTDLFLGNFSNGVPGSGFVIYVDDVVVDTSYIGPVAAGGSIVPIILAHQRRLRG